MKSFTKLLEGIVRYSLTEKSQTLFSIKAFGRNPQPLSLVFSCMDCRVFPSRFMQSELGENFIIRNPGNLVPYPDDLSQIDNATSIAGALDLTCSRLGMNHVVMIGHSDCRAMLTLHGLKDEMHNKSGAPLDLWLKKHGLRTLEKFKFLKEENQFMGPVPYKQNKHFTEVFIDPERKFNMVDKLSQVNCIQQLENLAAYPFLIDRLNNNTLHLHALWYDLHTGSAYLLSRKQQRFVEVNEESFFSLAEEVKLEEDKGK